MNTASVISHIGLTVKDLEKSVAFYQLLHFSPESKIRLLWDDFWKDKNAFYQLPEGTNATVQYLNHPVGASVELFQFDQCHTTQPIVWNKPGAHHFAMKTTDIESLFQTLADNGAEIALPIVSGKKQQFFFAKDPDGNLLEIAQPY